MSYDAAELGVEIRELFADAAYAALPPKLRLSMKLWRPSRRKLPPAEVRRRKKERRKQMEAHIRALRVEEREANHAKLVLNTELTLMKQLAPQAVKRPYYC